MDTRRICIYLKLLTLYNFFCINCEIKFLWSKTEKILSVWYSSGIFKGREVISFHQDFNECMNQKDKKDLITLLKPCINPNPFCPCRLNSRVCVCCVHACLCITNQLWFSVCLRLLSWSNNNILQTSFPIYRF